MSTKPTLSKAESAESTEEHYRDGRSGRAHVWPEDGEGAEREQHTKAAELHPGPTGPTLCLSTRLEDGDRERLRHWQKMVRERAEERIAELEAQLSEARRDAARAWSLANAPSLPCCRLCESAGNEFECYLCKAEIEND